MTTSCRACGTPRLHEVLDLGDMPLVNDLWSTPEGSRASQVRHRLVTAVCESCTLLQLTEEVAPERMFREYSYFSSYSQTMVNHAESLARQLTWRLGLNARSSVIELASNDGYLLQHYKRMGVPVLGIEPAANVAEVAWTQKGIPTLAEFFDSDFALEMARHGQLADVVHAHNVLAHVPDPRDFLQGIATILEPEGMAVIEVPHVVQLVDHGQFDTIYHEHLCYFSLTALKPLFERAGLSIDAVDTVPVHGGSLRVFASLPGVRARDRSVDDVLAQEQAWGVSSVFTYEAFATRALQARAQIRAEVDGLVRAGKRIAGYGASAKGCVLLNFAGLDVRHLEFVVDRSPHKVGRFIPGTGIPVRPTGHLLESMPDYVLMLVWNIAEEVLRQEREYVRRGGQFMVPIPEMKRAA